MGCGKFTRQRALGASGGKQLTYSEGINKEGNSHDHAGGRQLYDNPRHGSREIGSLPCCGVYTMIPTHSLGRAARYYPERTALASGTTRATFRELHDRVASIAAALSKHGFGVGDWLAILLPNEAEYIELVYACAWL